MTVPQEPKALVAVAAGRVPVAREVPVAQEVPVAREVPVDGAGAQAEAAEAAASMGFASALEAT